MSVNLIESKWSSGNLYFYEKAVGRSVTGDVFSMSTSAVTIGGTSQDIDFGWYASGSKSFVLDAGAGTLTITGLDVSLTGDLTIDTEDINLGDADDLEFGDSQDVLMRFSTGDASNHAFVLALDDTSQQMHITDKGAVATDWNRSAGTHPEMAIHSNTTPATDYIAIGNHDGTTAHIDVVGGTTLSIDIAGAAIMTVASTISVGVDGTGYDFKFFGDTASAYLMWDQSENALLTAGVARITLNGVASAGVTDGSVLRMGTSGSPLVDDQAGAGFIVGYFDSGATSGWPAGLFVNTNLTAAGGSFTALQGDAVLTAAKATVTGIENFMQLSTGGKVTGACRSVQGTIDFSNEDKGSGGCYSAACFNIKGEGAAVDIGTTQRVACIELKTEGAFSAVAGENFETKAAGYAIFINGFTAAAGVTNILSSTRLAELPAGTYGLRVGIGADGDAGSVYYIPLVPAAEWN